MEKHEFAELWTDAGLALRDSGEGPWQEYPRPSLRRESYLCLNGEWEFAATDASREPTAFDRRITVPFPPESRLSGIATVFPDGTGLWYRRRFTLPEGFCRGRVILHFGAADQTARVWLNGKPLGSHEGGYSHFSFDMTDTLTAGENLLTVCVTDELDSHILPYGKQKHKRGGMWYTPVSGIWQTVWAESVPAEYIRDILFETHGDRVFARIDGASAGEIRVFTPGGELSVPFSDGRAEFTLDSPRLWSPEDPYLYRAEVTAGEDKIRTYFAVRSLEIKTVGGFPRLCLNGKEYFFCGVLDQGYYPDGIFTPASPSLFEDDITAMKSLGFNTLRKHIKVEPELFYYACDRLGMVVFQDMVNNGRYSFLRDTALPTIGIKGLPDRRMHRDRRHRDGRTREAFMRGMEETVGAVRRHPSVCYYTIFNEGWGQFCGDDAYRRLRALDDTRFIDTASGWFRCRESDVESLHVYFKPVKMPKSQRPIVLSEFGGYSYKLPGHAYNTEKTYGYRFFDDPEKFEAALRRLFDDEVLPARGRGLSAAIYTQLSDVEDETNGLLTYDRKPKIKHGKILK